jgi:radical SAM protein with 4Fe4S-binding SPASM domain
MSISKKVANMVGYGNALKIKYFFQKPKPKEIIIDICAACNAACPFCPRIYMPEERSKGYMDLKLFKFILKEAQKEGIKNIRLYSTAEPTLHPKFDEIIDLLVKGGFYISVSTNASMLDKHIDSLMKVDILQYSIEGWDKESYEKYRIPLKFDKIYENITIFHEARKKAKISPKVSTNLLLTKSTDLKKYMELWADFIDIIKIHFMAEATMYQNEKFVSLKNKDILDEYYNFKKQRKDFMCTYPFSILTIAFDGEIALCCNDFSASMDIGNIRDGIKEVFSSPGIEAIRKEFYSQNLDKCKGCSFFSVSHQEDVDAIKAEISQLDSRYQIKIQRSF